MSSLLRVRSANSLFRRHLSDYFAEQKIIEKHAAETASTWKYVSLFVAIPACGYLFYKHILNGEEEHHTGEWIPYDHMRIRKRPFPWGDESLFHSKHSPGPNQASHEDESEPKENFITAFIRKLRDDHCERDWKLQMQHAENCHQKMMEHIEMKKFPTHLPQPSYARIFSKPRWDLQDERARRPVGLDD